MKTVLTVEIEYDPSMTDPEGLACAMDRLLEMALSTPDIMSEYGDPTCGEFFVAKETVPPAGRTVTRRWVLYNSDSDRLLTTRTYDRYDDAAEAANQVTDVLVLPLAFEEVKI